jgi:Ca2+/Na+ antiporter
LESSSYSIKNAPFKITTKAYAMIFFLIIMVIVLFFYGKIDRLSFIRIYHVYRFLK